MQIAHCVIALTYIVQVRSQYRESHKRENFHRNGYIANARVFCAISTFYNIETKYIFGETGMREFCEFKLSQIFSLKLCELKIFTDCMCNCSRLVCVWMCVL